MCYGWTILSLWIAGDVGLSYWPFISFFSLCKAGIQLYFAFLYDSWCYQRLSACCFHIRYFYWSGVINKGLLVYHLSFFYISFALSRICQLLVWEFLTSGCHDIPHGHFSRALMQKLWSSFRSWPPPPPSCFSLYSFLLRRGGPRTGGFPTVVRAHSGCQILCEKWRWSIAGTLHGVESR